MCAFSAVVAKATPAVVLVPVGTTTVNVPLLFFTTCVPPGCAILGTATATVTLFPLGGGPPIATGTLMFNPGVCGTLTVVNVPVPVPPGTTGTFVVVGNVTLPVTTPSGTQQVSQTADTYISFVEPAPGNPGVPRLDMRLIDPGPANPFIIAGPGSQVAATYRITNNDPTESVTLTLTGESEQAARLPSGSSSLVFSIAAPFTGDDFPIAFDAGQCAIPLAANPNTYEQPPITQTITLAPGASKEVKVQSRSYMKCMSGSCSEQPLFATGFFEGGDPVEAVASTAHFVEVGLPNNCCGVPDAKCPRCGVAGPFTNPQGQSFIEVTLQDMESGLGFIVPTHQANMTLSNPNLMYGTTSPITITGTKIDQTRKSSVQFLVVDACGNKVVCDPVITDVLRDNGKPVEQTHTNIPALEHLVTVVNGAPGIKHLDVIVNGQTHRITGLKDGEERTIDVAASMLPGDANTITLRTTGKPGSSATVMIWDGNL